MSGFIKCSNGPSVSLKKEFYSVAVQLLASQVKFWSMNLVDFAVVKHGELNLDRLLDFPSSELRH